ncbi:MAG: RNA methyltransferase [Phyllobacteriaceae bacterium]|nr:RNA methyltransferase [Phyllobacteriaceae bacterium]
MCGISNPENIGSIFRNAAGLGMDAIVLDAQCSHPLMRRAVRVSMGTVLALPWLQLGATAPLLNAVEAAGFTLYALTPAAAQNLADVAFAPRSAIIFGEEAHGLDEAVIARCTGLAIPMAGGVDSLNVAATSAIVFNALRDAKPPG